MPKYLFLSETGTNTLYHCMLSYQFFLQSEAQRLGQEHDRASAVIASRDAELGKCAVEATTQKAELASLRAELMDAQVRTLTLTLTQCPVMVTVSMLYLCQTTVYGEIADIATSYA